MENDAEVTVSPEATLKDAMGKINVNRFGIVFVVDEDDRLLGAVTDGDIRRGILDGKKVTEAVRTVATTDPVTAYESWGEQEFNQHITPSVVRQHVGHDGTLTIPVLNDDDQIVSVINVDGKGEQVSEQMVRKSVETVLVIGGAGYLGSQLCRELLESGYNVRVLDKLLFGTTGIDDIKERENFTLLQGDMRDINAVVDAVKGSDAVVHLGGLVGDPASALDPQETLELNYHATRMIAEVCKYHQINRFIFASTCSVYGKSASPETLLDETSELNPVSLYAQTNIQSEEILSELMDENFAPTILRMATLYGYSPRMRFDLVVNILTAKAQTESVVPIFGGDQYRPNLHVRDAARAYTACLDAPLNLVKGEVFNVGSNAQNYQISEVGEIISECFPEASIDWQREKEDERSYQVDFSKITDTLGYDVSETIEDAALEIKSSLEDNEFTDISDDNYSNYRTTKKYVE
jgi:nucleoside-diphosphate-sugar epimerase